MAHNLAIIPVAAPTIDGLSATATLKGILLAWTALQNANLFAVEIWSSITSNRSAATLLATVTNNSFLHTGLSSNTTRYYWVRSKNIYGRTDGAWTPVSPTAGVTATTLLTQTSDLNSNAATNVVLFQSGITALQTIFNTYASLFRYSFYGTGNAHVIDMQHISNFDITAIGTVGQASSYQKFDISEHTYHNTGSVSVTNGSAIIIGSGTTWLVAIAVGNIVIMPNNSRHVVLAVDSNTQITLTAAYAGATASAQPYLIITATTLLTSVILETARYKISGTYCLTFEYPFAFRTPMFSTVGKLYDVELFWKMERGDASWTVTQTSVLRAMISEEIKR